MRLVHGICPAVITARATTSATGWGAMCKPLNPQDYVADYMFPIGVSGWGSLRSMLPISNQSRRVTGLG